MIDIHDIESDIDVDAHEEMMELARQAEEERKATISAISKAIIEKRKEAVAFRMASGIEAEWDECDDSYSGIDDANRHTEKTAKNQGKPLSDGGPISGGRKSVGVRSTAFLNITRPYCDAASARVSDMLSPTDDRNFSISSVESPDIPVDLAREIIAEGQSESGDLYEMLATGMRSRAERAQKIIDNWLIECRHHSNVRLAIDSCVKLGTGVIKGPVPVVRKKRSISMSDGVVAFSSSDEIHPASFNVDPRNLYPDPACGEDIHNGSFIFERDTISGKQIMELIGQPGYINEEILSVITEGPSKINTINSGRTTTEKDRFDIWYYHGNIKRSDFESISRGGGVMSDDESLDSVNICATIINDRAVKVARSHLDSGDFPYDVIVWQRRSDMPWGIGVAKQISVPQRMLNAATRNMSNNSSLASGPQIVRMKGVCSPADGVSEITPLKQWEVDSNADIRDVRAAFTTVEIPSRQVELMNVINFALKIAEDITGLPMLMQGSQGKAPDTVGGMQILNNNANVVLKRIAKMFDDQYAIPHIKRYYEWLMLYGPDDAKGDYTVDARGSSVLVERDIYRQSIMAMAPFVVDPRFGASPEKWFEEVIKINKIDKKAIMLTDQEKEAMLRQEQMQQAQMMPGAQ